jgi:hypothetical protein
MLSGKRSSGFDKKEMKSYDGVAGNASEAILELTSIFAIADST